MLAVVTTDYPLDAGRGDRVPAPRGRRELQPHLGRRRVLDERHGPPARERRQRRRRGRRRIDAAFAAALREVCADLAGKIVADGEGATVLARDRRDRRGERRRGDGDRAADRDLAARQDGAVRARPELGPRARGRRLGHVERRLRTARPRARLARVQRDDGLSRTAPRSAPSPTSRARACRIELDLGLGDGHAAYLASDLTYDYVRINAEYTT